TGAVLVDFGAGTYRGAKALTWHAMPPGTPQYRSPQALRFHVRWRPEVGGAYEATPADDLYALGVTAYRMVTGEYPPPHVQVEVGEREEDDTPKWVPPEQVVTVSPKLAALIRQLLSVEPEARGSARQVAEAAERAARREGRRADAPITVRPARKATVYPKWARAVGPVLVRASWLAAAAGVGMVLTLWLRPQVVKEGRAGRQLAAQAGAQEGSAVGLAEAEEARQAIEPRQSAENESISREMPKEPLPGQLRPPCKAEHEEVIRGGCWSALKRKPPCGKDSYEWKGGCYLASFPPARPATSDKQ
ncbi:MAG TPA: serine/threonine protein kinase, partial [Myxococcaceae bacterium]|nr:serine/threonine protein kinase [Myxococcaceae bacterium]